jgi:tape measure domain-containing protein
MSKTIDERVVSMQFDNKQFEANVSTTMSTIDKLKQKLNFSGAAKGLENVNAASKKVNMNGISGAVDTVQAKFTALEVMGVTALANITNAAVNAGKRIVSALTIDPIKTGFQEYETQINAVQTILANTESKGTTIDDVNKALDTLNEYADKTIYNFTEMTRNIGTFTAAGVDLNTSVNAIQGIANLAAVSGSTSQQASTAMYQLSQALAAGTVKLMDWNSVVNAGMGGEVFQNALKETARVHGVAIDKMIKDQGSFRETLSEGWLTSEILTETLQKFTLTTEGLTDEQIKANREMLRAKGYTEAQIDEIFKLGTTATNAATKVKTFTQLWDVLKESAQSGWSKTWKIIFGDFEEAKNLFTPLANVLTNIINKISDARNKLLEGAMASPFGKLAEKIKTVTGVTKKMAEASDSASKKLKNISEVANEVISGKWGDTQKRWNALAEAGYNWATVQNKVNEELGCSVRHNEELAEKQIKLTNANKELSKVQVKSVEDLFKLNEAQLKALGFTKEEIKALKELEDQAEKAGVPLKDVLKDMSLLDGRNLLINSFKNIGNSIATVFKTIRDAWDDTFDPIMTEERLYNIIAALHKFTTKLKMSEENVEKLKTTFEGLFSALDIVLTLVGGPLKIVFKVISKILQALDYNILDLTSAIGQAIIDFRDWLDETLNFTEIFNTLLPYLTMAEEAIRNWISSLKDSEILKNITSYLKESAESFRKWIDGIKDAENIPEYIIQGLVNGLKSGASAVWNAIVSIAKGILTKICEVLGIHSPSTEFIKIGENSMEGLVEGIQNGASKVWEVIKGIAEKLVDFFKNINWGSVFAAGLGGGLLVAIIKIVNVIDKFASVFSGAGEALEGLGDMFTGLGKSFKASAWEKKSQAIKNMAISIGILVASLYVLTKMCEGDSGDLWEAVGVLGVLSLIVAGLAVACGKLNNSMTTLDKNGLKSSSTSFSTIIAIGGAVLLMSIALKKIADIDSEDTMRSIGVLSVMLGEILLVILAFSKLSKIGGKADIAGAGSMLLKMGIALLLMTTVMKQVSKMESGDIIKGLAVITLLGSLVTAFIYVSKFAGEHASKAGSMLLKMSLAMVIMVGVVKLAAGMDETEISKGLGFIAAVEILFMAVVAVSKFAGEHASKAGTMMLLMSGAIFITAQVIKQISGMSESDIKKGIKVIATLEILFAAVIAVSKLAGQNATKAGMMLILMSGALLIVTGIMFILSKFEPEGLKRALTAISVLEACFAGLIAITAIAKDSKGMLKVLITMTSAVTLMAIAIAALSLIDPSRLGGATAALSSVIGTFALLVGITKLAKNTNQMIRTLVVLTGIILVLAGIVTGLSYINPDNALKNTAALSLLMTSFAVSLAILGTAGKISKTVVKQMAPMLAIIAGLATILTIMSLLEVESSIQNSIALGVFLSAMSISMVILSTTRKVSNKALGSLAILGLVVAEIAAIFLIMKELDITPSLEAALALSTILLAMSTACLIVSMIPSSAAITGALGLAAFVGIMTVVLSALGGLSKIPGFNELIKDGGETLSLIGYAIGNFVGSILGGFSAGASSGLPEIGSNLSAFMTNATPFITGLKMIDDQMLKGVAILSASIIALTTADMISAISSFISGGDGLAQLGTELSMFMTNAMPFIMGISMIDPSAMDAAKNLAGVLLALTTAELINSINSFISGSTDISEFSSKLIPFGEAMVEFSGIVSGNIDANAVTAAANAGKTMAEMAKSLPTDPSSVFGFFSHNTGMNEFGAQLVPFGRAMVRFSQVVAGNIDANAVTSAANAGKTMAEMAKTLPEDPSSVFGFFSHNTEMNEFGAQLVPFGRAMVRFSSIVAGNIDQSAVEGAANAGKTMAELANELPRDSATVFGFFDSKYDLNEFGNQLVPFGRAMVRFSQVVAGNIDQGAVESATSAGTVLSGIAEGLPRDPKTVFGWFDSKTDMSEFGDQIVAFGKAMADFSKAVSGNIDTSSVTTTVNAANTIFKMGSQLSKKTITMEGLSENLTSLANSMLDFSNSISGKIDLEAIKIVTEAGKTLSEAAKIMPQDADMSRITVGLKSFGESMIDFSETVQGKINPEDLKNAVITGKDIATMLSGIPTELNLSNFSIGLKSLGTAMVDFSTSIKEGGIDKGVITNATDAGKLITDFISTIPDYIDITDFSNNVAATADAILSFSNKVKEGAIDKEAITNATDAGKQITNFISTIPDYIEMTDFANKAASTADAIVSFSNKVSNGAIDKEAITNATNAGKQISDFISTIPDYIEMTDFSNNVASTADAIVSFSNKVEAGVNKDAIIRATDAGKKINAFIKEIPEYGNITKFIDTLPSLATSLKDFSDNVGDISTPNLSKVSNELKKLANSGITSFIEAFSKSKSKIANAGGEMINNLVKGIKVKSNAVESIMTKVSSNSLSAVKSKFSNFYNAGSYLVDGFAMGISANSYKAAAKARAMAKAAAQAAEDELDINSPSKVFRSMGYSIPEGFAMGIDKYSSMVKDSSVSMAKVALDGTKSAIYKISDIVNSDIDAQPTIRPVLDLSDIKSGANAIDGMLGVGSSIGVLSNVGTISYMMNRNNQNGVNDDVVSAIDKLRKDLGNINNTTYSINGVTYDDGSNISNAVKTLVRAAKIERRV